MKHIFVSIFMIVLMMPFSYAVNVGSGVGVGIGTEDFEPLVWMCDSRVVLDDSTEPGRFSFRSIGTDNMTVVLAADRIVDLQFTNGAWDWIVTNETGPTGTTYLNIAGVTAEVLLDAYAITGDTTYLDAARDAGDYLIAEIGSPISATQRQNAFNAVFLYHLYDATGEVQYRDQADEIIDHVVNEENYWTNNNGNHCTASGCSASQLLEAIKNFRSGFGDPSGLVVWDLHTFIEAAQRAGENAFATDLANELLTYMSQVGFDDSIQLYVLGLSAGIVALNNAGLDYSPFLAALLAEQGVDGSFSGGSIQDTAYALIALTAVGENDAAFNAATFLVNEFGYDAINGWLETDSNEYSEVTSEAAQALFAFISGEEILSERTQNYAFEGEQIQWKVLVMDKNGIQKIEDVYGTVGTSGVGTGGQGAGNPIEVNCVEDLAHTDGETLNPACNARILEEELTVFDSTVHRYYDCKLTIETPVSMYGEYWLTVEAVDLDGLVGVMDEDEYWFLNPVVALTIDGTIDFTDVRPGTQSYSETLLVGNDADDGSGVMMDMFISGTDFYDSQSSGAACPDTNQLALGTFSYFATNGAYSTATDAMVGARSPAIGDERARDLEGYVNIGYGIGFNDPTPFYDGFEIMQAAPLAGGYWAGNVLAPGAEVAVTFKLALPEPCNGDFDTGAIYFWGEAI